MSLLARHCGQQPNVLRLLRSHDLKSRLTMLTKSANLQNRCVCSSAPRRVEYKDSQSAQGGVTAIYQGPLAKTFRSLKIFSLSSMGLATALTPFMFIMETSLPFVARVALASTAMSTSLISTAMVAWCGKPYVKKIYKLGGAQGTPESADVLQLETFDVFLRPRFTNVYDTAFLTETRRPFARWELAESLHVTKPDESAPEEETIAETLGSDGRVLGRWIVKWDSSRSTGICHAEGKVQRHFNVHEEILPNTVK